MWSHPIQLDWRIDPLAVLKRWPADRRIAMLHSGRFDSRWARYSILAEPIGDYFFTPSTSPGHAHATSGTSLWRGPSQLVNTADFTHHFTHDLRQILRQHIGLWVGYLGYELGQHFEPKVLEIKQEGDANKPEAKDDRHWPWAGLACCPGWLVYDASSKQWSAHGDWGSPSKANGWWSSLPDLPEQESTFVASGLTSQWTRSNYESAVEKVRAYIAAGDIFQANLTQRLTADFQGAYPLAQRAAFVSLNQVSPAWYGAYLETARPEGGATPGPVIASTSPELFLEVDASGQITTRPIKGTRPASHPVADLDESEKDKAELNMIVDLLRNDLGRVCQYGSVRVPQPRVIETHPTVHHGVATIQGRLQKQYDLVDLLQACFPGGSITGAPKIRAMQIIRELEPSWRGPYCGCLGWMTANNCTVNIAIRTLLIDPVAKRVDFSVGGGIVADSLPTDEYNETLTKASALLQALRLDQPS